MKHHFRSFLSLFPHFSWNVLIHFTEAAAETETANWITPAHSLNLFESPNFNAPLSSLEEHSLNSLWEFKSTAIYLISEGSAEIGGGGPT